MYEEYFGLNRPPFKITPDTSLFYGGGKRGDILGALVYAIGRGEGIVKVVGEVGSGKTMLCRMLQLELPQSVEIIYIANPSVSAEDILFVIAHELEMRPSRDASKHEVMHMLQDYLVQRHMENKQVVLFVEEAQCMPLETLEEIRLLSNLETGENKLLQMVLFGQPELDQNLAQKSIRQLRERITHSFHLSPLTHEEILSYLNFRMREVGYTGPELINVKIAKKIERYSGGLLRRINIIADKILLSAFAENTHNLSVRHVIAAVNDSSFGQDELNRSGRLWWLIFPLLLAFAYGIYKSEILWSFAIAAKSPMPVIKQVEFAKPVTDQPGLSAETIESVPAVDLAESAVKVVGKSSVVTVSSEATVIAAETAPKIEELKKDAEPVPPKNKPAEKAKLAELPDQWLRNKLQQSREWLSNAPGDNVSIQVLMRRKSAGPDLVNYLKNEWPLDLQKTYIYEVSSENRNIYRVFYSEFDSMAAGRREIMLLPDSVKVNEPYLNSVHRMQKALL